MSKTSNSKSRGQRSPKGKEARNLNDEMDQISLSKSSLIRRKSKIRKVIPIR